VTLCLATADDTAAIGRALGQALETARPGPVRIWLRGPLGAGKTTLVRALLGALGHDGRVPSPTYTLVESYRTGGWRVQHADLYRLRMPVEVDELALGDGEGADSLLLVEWPEQAVDRLPTPDLELLLEHADQARRLTWVAATPRGQRLAAHLER
jgi:tRNA threonylcarbamoyladenosine biosynthesis protein TsaE